MSDLTVTDLEIAKAQLYEENLTLAIVKDGALLYSTKSHRISGFLDAIEKCGEKLQKASVADRIAGKAIALLCAYAEIKEVYAAVLSRKAMTVFKQHKIGFYWNELVDNVLDSSKTAVCPFEKAASKIATPEQAYKIFKEIRESFKACKS